MNAACVKVSDAQQMGQYKQTALDAAKQSAAFRLVDVSCSNRIVWADGRAERVTDRRLSILQRENPTWKTDF